MLELETVTVQGFKSLASVEKLSLGAINVLIGPNGSGKSNLIGVFRLLESIRDGRLQDYAGKMGVENLLHFGPKKTSRLTLGFAFANDDARYDLLLEPGFAVELLPVSETVQRMADGVEITERLTRHGREAGLSHTETQGPIARWIANRMAQWRIYHFHDTGETSALRRAADLEDNRALRTDGANLPAFLYLLQQRHVQAYHLLRRTVQRVVPFFEDFLLRPSPLNPGRIKLEWRHRESDAYFDAWALSDGTLRFIALAAVFLQPAELRPPLILVDEPELGLHPFAISLLGSMAKMAAMDSQIILATQSPLLLDEFEPQDVLVAGRDGHATVFQRLDAASLEDWLAEYSLGELWEKNELGGRPAAWRA
ncbi:MAG: AAA family ATPase [Anaerolineae bacterium]